MGTILDDLSTLASTDPTVFKSYVRALEVGEVYPPEIKATKPLDMLLKLDPTMNRTVMLSANTGGLLASFKLQDHVRTYYKEPAPKGSKKEAK